MDYTIEILNFVEVYENFQTGDQITIYDKTGKNNSIVTHKSNDSITIKNLETNISTTYTYDKFIKNEYEIYDIVYENRFVVDVNKAVFQIDFDAGKKVGEEIYIENKAEWEQIFPLDEQREDLYNYYLQEINNPSKFYIQSARKRADTFYELVDFYQDRDQNGLKKNTAIKMSTILPQLDLFKNHDFKSNYIFPIVDDTKYIFSNKLFRGDEDDDISDPRVEYMNLLYQDGDTVDLKTQMDFKITLQQAEEVDLIWRKNGYNFDTANQYLYGDTFKFNEKDIVTKHRKTDEMRNVMVPIYRAYKPTIYRVDKPTKSSYNSYYTIINNEHDFFAYRNISPDNPYYLADNTEITMEKRLVNGRMNKLIDIVDLTPISEKCQICHGTAQHAERKYGSSLDKYVVPGKKFDNKISREPVLRQYVYGEEAKICGLLIKNPKNIYVDFNYIHKTILNETDYIINNPGGYWNILDKNSDALLVHKSSTNNIKTTIYEDNIELDYLTDNFIVFPKGERQTREQFNTILENLIPNQNDIFTLEYDNISQATNFTAVNKILSKYLLSITNLTLDNYYKISSIFKSRIDDYRLNAQLSKTRREFYTDLNKKLNTIFDELYSSLFLVSSDLLTPGFVLNKLRTIFKNYENNNFVVNHILRYYYGKDVNFKSDNDTLLAQLIYEKYVDYVNNRTSFNVLFYPSNQISNQKLVKLIDYIKSYYNINSLSIHTPRNISVINEILNIIVKKDSGEKFKLLLAYLYAMRSLIQLDTENEVVHKTYGVDTLTIETKLSKINKEIETHYVTDTCHVYKVSKIYKNLDNLNDENPLVDKQFSENLKIANFLDKNRLTSKNLLSDLQKAFPLAKDLQSKIKDHLDGKLNIEPIQDGDYSILADNKFGVYAVYKRVNNAWEFNNNILDTEIISVLGTDKPVKDLQLKSLCNYTGKNILYVDGLQQLLVSDCTQYNTMCISKTLKELLVQRENLESGLKSQKYIEEQRSIIGNLILEVEKEIDNGLTIEDTNTRNIYIHELTATKKLKHNVLESYVRKFYNLKQIVDDDLKLNEIEKFITNHGLFNRKFNVEKGVLERVNFSETDDIYWDIPGVSTKLCCKHWLVLVKQAWKSNTERKLLQDLLENTWGVKEVNAKFIFCRNCREVIGNGVDSDHEGFSDEGGRVQIREAIYEDISDVVSDELVYNDANDMVPLLNSITAGVKIHFTPKQQYDVISGANKVFNDRHKNMSFSIFDEAINKKDSSGADFLSTLFDKPEFNNYADFRSKYISVYKTVDPSNYEENAGKIDGSDRDRKLFVAWLKHAIIPAYEAIVKHNKLVCLIANVVLIIYITYPAIEIESTGTKGEHVTLVGSSSYEKLITETFNDILKGQKKLLEELPKFLDSKKQVSGYLAKFNTETISLVKTYLGEENISKILENRDERLKQDVLNVIKRNTLLEWKTFRPYLKIAKDVSMEIEKLDMNDVEKFLDSGDKNSTQLSYYAYMLSNKLFYLLHKIISSASTEELLKNTFSNYCCLSNNRDNYMDFFNKKDDSIGKTLNLMKQIQNRLDYNPDERLVMIYDKSVSIETPSILDYINKYNIFENVDVVKDRIRKLVFNFILLDDENVHLTGQKRLYSKYYDEFLIHVGNKSKTQIAELLRESDPSNATQRLRNLYSDTNPGLILNDIITNNYYWTIEEKLNSKLAEISDSNINNMYHQLLSIIYNVNKLDKIVINSRNQVLVDSRDTQLRLQLEYIKPVFTRIKSTITRDDYYYIDLIKCLDTYINLDDKPDNLDNFMVSAWAPLMTKLGENNALLSELVSKNTDYSWIYSLDTTLNNIRQHITSEMNDTFNNQILIEGYLDNRETRYHSIEAQRHIREKYTQNRQNIMRLNFIREVYRLVVRKINIIKNLDIQSISETTFTQHKSLNPDSKLDVELKKYVLYQFFNDESIKEKYDNAKKNIIDNTLDMDCLDRLIGFESVTLFDTQTQFTIFDNKYISYILIYLIQMKLIEILRSDKIFIDYLHKFLWTSELLPMITLNSMTELNVNKHLRSILSRENDNRKTRFNKLDDNDKILHSLIRNLGLGKNIKVGASDELDELDEILNSEAAFFTEDAKIIDEPIVDGDGVSDDHQSGEQIDEEPSEEMQTKLISNEFFKSEIEDDVGENDNLD
jgi:hypothetical protein